MSARTKTMNVVFELTSIGLLIAFSLMVWADYDRPWKKYQIEFNKLEVKLTKDQRDAALGKVDAAKAKALEAQIADGEKQIAAHADEVRKLRAEVDRLVPTVVAAVAGDVDRRRLERRADRPDVG